jgi:membrane protease subunit (stomatin/prohibitin family)
MTKIINYHGSMDALVWIKEIRSLTPDTELVVPVAHEAVFIRDGRITDSFTMGRHSLKEAGVGEGHLFASEGDKADCRVYYVKKEGAYNIKWGAPQPLRFIDPLLKVPVEFDLSGVFAIKIIDTKQFLSQLLAFTKRAALEEVKTFFRERMAIYIKDPLLSLLNESRISVITLPSRLTAVSKDLEFRLRYMFESFGVSIEGFMLKKVELVGGGSEAVTEKVAQMPAEEAKPAAEIMYCPKCGVALPPMSVFCFKCGVNLTA